MRANVKLIYPSCMENGENETFLLELHTFLRNTCFCVSMSSAKEKRRYAFDLEAAFVCYAIRKC